MAMSFLTQTCLLLCHLLLVLPSLSLSDPRISQSGLFCSPSKVLTKNFVPTFVKEMETLSQLITSSHFATFHVNLTTVVPPMYGLAQCHHDLSQTDCLLCFAASRTKLPRCLPSLSAGIFLDGCFLRYDNYSFYGESTSPLLDSVKCSSQNATVSMESISYAVGNVTRIAEGNGGFGVVGVNGVYALAQCWDSLGRDACRECLEKATSGVIGCGHKREGRALNAGCYLRYSDHKFFNHAGYTHQNHVFRGGSTVAIALATSAFVMLFLFAGYAVYARLSKMKERHDFGLASVSMKKSYASFKYETLEKATDYFNPSKKLGQGGAGSVYLGTLPNGKTVAVKRLIYNTRQWADDFFNEVNLISKIQHKNLVKLLGCSIEGPESLLVYEYIPNKSLDQFIFEKNKTKHLNWKQRLNIIVGAAEGLAYLHEGSDIRIIHRDIKSSNILLDEDLTPKIADFGLVRCFAADKSHISTGVAGTLLNRLVEAVDLKLQGDFPPKEARNVLQIGLLCTQATVALRPSMAQVIQMLTDENCEISVPNQPPFLSASTSVSTSPCNTRSFITNAVAKIEVSYTSSDSSSIQGSIEQSRSR